ncbi:ABC transporter permease [Paenibacillus chungangensis]|uniref:Transport permease protein n=1 Tax=Paenibacillus chungangensis TaxID=696535 RepID=A0ABW3HWR7_9BACL
MRVYLLNMYKYRDLFIELVRKDIKLKYRNSILGVLWSMLNPLLMMLVLSIVFMTFFKNDIPNFPVYVLIGRILYQFFSESTNFAMDSILSNGALIRKVYVPKYYFPLSRLVSSFVSLILSLVPLLGMMIATGMSFTWVNLLFFVPLVYLLLICGGLGLILASINVFFKDVKHFYSIIMLVVMYMTPIFYPVSIIPEQYMPIILMNPLYPIVEMFRGIVMYSSIPNMQLNLLALSYAVIYSVIGLLVFYKSQDKFIYHL